jgi:uncharacterized protein YdiU (UPF0061 family)
MLNFDNRFVDELPADPISENTRRQVHGACFSRVVPTPVRKPRLVAYSKEVAADLGLDEDWVKSDEFAQVFGGNTVLEGMKPFAACYGGHQFGHWAGQLGDGRAISLGEVVNDAGNRFELQLKGAGPTPYSRTADGRAVMRSSVRAFLCSEAMFHLGVPTTRALSLIDTGDLVVRDMFYDGRARPEPGAVVCRVSPSFIRFGSFEILASRGDLETLQSLVDFTLSRDFPEFDTDSPGRHQDWYNEVCRRTAVMVVEWMRVGFVHGVMNTDNMSILGLTIDYGPYGWLEDFDPDWTPNTTDAQMGRYRYGHQPFVAHWNLARLGEALMSILGVEGVEAGLDVFAEALEKAQKAMIVQKLGLGEFQEKDEVLASELFGLLTKSEADMTLFFRELANVDIDAPSLNTVHASFYREARLDEHRDALTAWLGRWAHRVRDLDSATRITAMNAANPRFVLRNYLAQLAIDAAEKGDFSVVEELLDTLRRPYDEQPGREAFAEKRPEWARNRPGCSTLSCSS